MDYDNDELDLVPDTQDLFDDDFDAEFDGDNDDDADDFDTLFGDDDDDADYEDEDDFDSFFDEDDAEDNVQLPRSKSIARVVARLKARHSAAASTRSRGVRPAKHSRVVARLKAKSEPTLAGYGTPPKTKAKKVHASVRSNNADSIARVVARLKAKSEPTLAGYGTPPKTKAKKVHASSNLSLRARRNLASLTRG